MHSVQWLVTTGGHRPGHVARGGGQNTRGSYIEVFNEEALTDSNGFQVSFSDDSAAMNPKRKGQC